MVKRFPLQLYQKCLAPTSYERATVNNVIVLSFIRNTSDALDPHNHSFFDGPHIGHLDRISDFNTSLLWGYRHVRKASQGLNVCEGIIIEDKINSLSVQDRSLLFQQNYQAREFENDWR